MWSNADNNNVKQTTASQEKNYHLRHIKRTNTHVLTQIGG